MVFDFFSNEKNASASTPGWVSGPNTRGTYDILTTCLVTIVLCVWTAVHPNIPAIAQKTGQIWRKAGWLVLGLLAPELVVYTAWYQRREAMRIMNLMNKSEGSSRIELGQEEAMGKVESENVGKLSPGMHELRQSLTRTRSHSEIADPEKCPIEPGLSKSSKRGIKLWNRLYKTIKQKISRDSESKNWSMVNGSYAVMGGYTIQGTEDADGLAYCEEATPTGAGLEFLKCHAPELMKRLSNDEISDKSKADWIAKLLACWQAFGFAAQVITRLFQSLPTSLLELNTFAHAFCALLVYYLWWQKPMNILIPTPIHGLDICVWLQLDNMEVIKEFHPDKRQDALRYRINDWVPAAIRIHKYFVLALSPFVYERSMPILDSTTKDDSTALDQYYTMPEMCSDPKAPTPNIEFVGGVAVPRDPTTNMVVVGDILPQFQFKIRKHYKDGVLDTRYPEYWFSRWKLASNAMCHRPCLDCPGKDKTILEYNKSSKKLQKRARNLPPAFDTEPRVFAAFILATLIYGGFHAFGWNANSGRPVQQILWRISASIIMASGLIVWILYPAITLFRQSPTVIFPKDDDQRKRTMFIILAWIYTVLIYLLALVYLGARCFLVIECFINLFQLPVGAYDLPQWPTYLPIL